MPSANISSTPVGFETPEVTARTADLSEYTVAFETYHQDVDPSPFFKGLPNDHCQAEHCGYVTKGQVTFTYEDGSSETFIGGDAYHVCAGHLPVMTAGSSVVEFTLTSELNETMAVVGANIAAAGIA